MAISPNPGLEKIAGHMVDPELSWPPPMIRLDSNENALGPSPHAIAIAQASAFASERYIANQDRFLVPAIAEKYSLDPDRIAIGCGSDDLLARLVKCYLGPSRQLLRSQNSYLKTPRYALAAGGEPVSIMDHAFTVVVDNFLAQDLTKVDIIYLANPDNPSGTMISCQEILRLHQNIPARILLIVDCAYEEYIDDGCFRQMKELVEQSPNVVFTRTFSKVFGLAGARIGWSYSSREVQRIINKASLTFPLSSTSLRMGLMALEDQNHADWVISHNRKVRVKFTSVFAKMGLRVYPSQANFLLLEFPPGQITAADAELHLRKKGVWVRRFAAASYDSCFRITLGLEKQLAIAAGHLQEFLGRGS